MGYPDEILDEEFDKEDFFLESSHLLLYLSIPIIILQFCKLYYWADPSFGIPDFSILLSFIPDFFISSTDEYETMLRPELILIFVSFYLFLLGVFYQIVRDKVNLKLKSVHILITTILVIFFFFLMIEDEKIYEGMTTPIQYYGFLYLFIFWIFVQVFIPMLHVKKWIKSKRKLK